MEKVIRDEAVEELRALQDTLNSMEKSIHAPFKRISEKTEKIIRGIKREKMICAERDCYNFAVLTIPDRLKEDWYCDRHYTAIMNEGLNA